MKRWTCGAMAAVVAGGLLAGGQASAQPLDAGLVPQGVKWVMHVDLDAFRASRLGQETLREQDDVEWYTRIGNVVGFDPMKTIRGMTLFGTGYEREATTMLIRLADEPGNLEGLMLAAPGYSSQVRGDRTIHSFMTEDAVRGDARLFVSIEPVGRGAENMIVAAYDVTTLESAIGRLDNPVRRADAHELNPQAGSIVFGRVFDLDARALEQAGGQHSAILSMVRDMAMDLAERDGRLTLSAMAVTVDDQRAEQLRQLTQGMLALAQFGDRQRPGAAAIAEMAQRVQVQRDGATVRASMDVATQRLIEEVRKFRDERGGSR